MQRNCRFEIISVSREGNSLPCSTEWDKSCYFTPSNLLPKSVVKMRHLSREQRYGISLMLQEGKSRKDIAKAIGVSSSTISRELRKKGTLYQYLRRKGEKYNKRGKTLEGKGYMPNRVDIEERPAIVDLKERFGDLEIDTVIGSNHKGTLVTINDRLPFKILICRFYERMLTL